MTGKGKPRTGDMETSFVVRSHDAAMSDEEYAALPKNPLYIVLDNLRSAFNVGAIFRLCDTMRVSGLYLCGHTASPPHVKLDKTSLGTIRHVPWRRFPTTLEAIGTLHQAAVPVWGAETTSHSADYRTIVYPEPLAVVFGNEALGIDPAVLFRCDKLVEIPLYGYKNSLNVATSCAVIGFKALETMTQAKKATAVMRQPLNDIA